MEMRLADRIEEEITADARRRDPDVNPDSIRLSERERIAYDAIERLIAEQNRKGSLSGLTDRDIKKLKKVVNSDDGA